MTLNPLHWMGYQLVPLPRVERPPREWFGYRINWVKYYQWKQAITGPIVRSWRWTISRPRAISTWVHVLRFPPDHCRWANRRIHLRKRREDMAIISPFISGKYEGIIRRSWEQFRAAPQNGHWRCPCGVEKKR